MILLLLLLYATLHSQKLEFATCDTGTQKVATTVTATTETDIRFYARLCMWRPIDGPRPHTHTHTARVQHIVECTQTSVQAQPSGKSLRCRRPKWTFWAFLIGPHFNWNISLTWPSAECTSRKGLVERGEKERRGSWTYPFVPRRDSFAAVPVECPARSVKLNGKIF